LEQALGGISKNSGAEYGLVYKPGSTSEIFGYVRYILQIQMRQIKHSKRTIFPELMEPYR
jgi:hypothetical protein